MPFKLNQIRQGLSWLQASIMRFQRDLMRLAWIFLFSHENASTNAAKRNGSWAHQQIDKITPSTTKMETIVDGVMRVAWNLMAILRGFYGSRTLSQQTLDMRMTTT